MKKIFSFLAIGILLISSCSVKGNNQVITEAPQKENINSFCVGGMLKMRIKSTVSQIVERASVEAVRHNRPIEYTCYSNNQKTKIVAIPDGLENGCKLVKVEYFINGKAEKKELKKVCEKSHP